MRLGNFSRFDDFLEIVFAVRRCLVAVEVMFEKVGVFYEDVWSLFR